MTPPASQCRRVRAVRSRLPSVRAAVRATRAAALPPFAELLNSTLQFRPPPGHQEELFDPRNCPWVDSQQPLRPLQPSSPAAQSSPPPLPSPTMHPSSPGILLPATQASDNEGHLAEEHHPVPKRTRRVTFEVKYMEVLDFFDEHPVTEAYKFKVGSSFGDIPQAEHTKTTDLGATVLDGFVEFFFKLHAENRSYGGDFDVSDMLVAVQDPLHVIINKCANLKASKLNIHKDLMKLVNALVKTRFGEDGKRPAYVGDFISRVEDLSPESDVEKEAWEIRLWVIRHHPLFIEPAKRRLLLTVFYKFYKTLDHTAAEQLIEKINKFCHPSFTAPKDKLIAAIYRKNHQRDYTAEPDLQEENDSYIAVFLHNFVVRGPEEAWAYGIELQELELIVAYYFGRLLPTFLEEMSSTTDKHEMLKEILAMYAERRSIARRAPG